MLERDMVRLANGRTWQVHRGGNGPDLVWFHGIFGVTAADRFLTRLTQHYRITAPVAPGFTDLAEIDDIDSVHDLALAYDDLISALRLTQPAFVGHSYGGMIAAELAAHVPATARRLVLLAPFGLWIDSAPVADIFSAVPMDQVLWHDKAALEQFKAETLPLLDPAEDVERAVGAARRLSAVAKFLWPIPDKGLRRRLGRIAAPTLVMFGGEDQAIPPVYAEEFRRGLRQAEAVLVPEAGHMLPYEQPAQVGSHILRFLLSG